MRAIILIAGVFLVLFSPSNVYAVDLTSESDLMTRIKIGEGSSHTVTFTLDAATTFTATETITLDFDEDSGGWVVDGTNAVVTDFGFNDGADRNIVGVDGDCAGHTGVDDVAVGISDSTGVITLEACSNYSASNSGATVNIEIGTAAGGTDRVANPTSADVYTVSIGGNFGDSGIVLVEVIDNDQVVVTGTVDETLSFSASDTTIGFGILTPTQSRYATGNGSGSDTEYAAHSLTIGTNAINGYTLTVNGNTLTSGENTIDAIGSVATAPNPGTEQFGIRITAAGGTGTVSAPYDGNNYALDQTSFPDEVAGSITTSADTVFSIRYLANISVTTDTGIYSAVLIFTVIPSF